MGSIFETTFSQIEYFYPKTRLSIVVFAVLLSTSIIPSSIINIFAILVVVSIGLMHGATDHILYINSDVAEFKSKIPKSFIIKYLFILAAMGLVWLLFPTMALILFLLISAYHFGQTQLQYLEISESDWRKKFYYTSWGFLVLCLIVLLNLEESKALINSAIPTLNLEIITFETADMTILSGSIVNVIMVLILFRFQKWQFILFELLELLAIALLSYKSNLLVSFGLFFGFWHSLRASQVQIDKIAKVTSFSISQFIKESLPFTLISIFGISLMLLAAYYSGSGIRVEMLFLVAISMLTLPHMFIYERFYNYFDRYKG